MKDEEDTSPLAKPLITASAVRQDTHQPLAQKTVLNEATTSAQTDTFEQEGTVLNEATTKPALIPK